uniref:Xylulose kinase-1 n=1 Tax=Tanacetum cinerariifolium TaxID=118510 RepID=A0A699GZU6_TANCI|nr:hypothetical protein [Tanacetum cinerariifolium]
MVAILEKTEHNTEYHQIVDFLKASHIKYALTIHLTVYVSHIRQFWSTARVETTDRETKILAQVNNRQRTISESSIRRHLKLNDKEEAFPTDISLDAGQDRENSAKTSSMPHKALPWVTSLGGGEGKEKRRICLGGCSKHRRMDQGEDLLVRYIVKDSDKSADKGSDSIDEMSYVLGSLGATNILASGGLRSVFTTASLSVATASIDISPVVATASGSFSTALIFTTTSVATPTTRVTRSSRGVVIGSLSLIYVKILSISKKDKEKGKMTKPEQPSKEEILEQMSIQLARDLEAKFAQKDLIIREQDKRDAEIAKIHAEKELEIMISELDRSNEMIAKFLSEYEQVVKYQAQQNKPAAKTERRNFYMSIQRSNAGWKAKDFKRITFEQIEEKFILVWEKMQDFVPMNSKLESERLKRQEIQLDKERSKKLKTAEASGTEPTQEQQSKEPKELSEEELKKMIELVPVEELYIEALQVRYPIIDWEIYSEGQRKCWKLIRVGNHTEVYQLFEDMLKKFDREDMDKL